MSDQVVGYCKGTVAKFGMCSHCTGEACEDFFSDEPVEVIKQDDKMVPRQMIQMLQQPLLTEEGFVNEACLNELESAIENMPKTYERLQGSNEWAQYCWTFRHEIVAAFANSAVRLSPVVVPDKLEDVLNYLNECLKIEFKKKTISFEVEDKTEMVPLSLCDINKLLHDILYETKFMEEWNTAPEENRSAFVDIDALFHNVSLIIRNERRCDKTEAVNPDGSGIKKEGKK